MVSSDLLLWWDLERVVWVWAVFTHAPSRAVKNSGYRHLLLPWVDLNQCSSCWEGTLVTAIIRAGLRPHFDLLRSVLTEIFPLWHHNLPSKRIPDSSSGKKYVVFVYLSERRRCCLSCLSQDAYIPVQVLSSLKIPGQLLFSKQKWTGRIQFSWC